MAVTGSTQGQGQDSVVREPYDKRGEDIAGQGVALRWGVSHPEEAAACAGWEGARDGGGDALAEGIGCSHVECEVTAKYLGARGKRGVGENSLRPLGHPRREDSDDQNGGSPSGGGGMEKGPWRRVPGAPDGWRCPAPKGAGADAAFGGSSWRYTRSRCGKHTM
jgi:hypothetical protein